MAYCYDGKTYETIKEMAEEYGIDRERIYSFRHRGWSLEEAMRMCIDDVRGRGRLFEYNGKLYRSPKALAEEYGLPWNSLSHYMQRCKTVEEAVKSCKEAQEKKITLWGKQYQSRYEVAEAFGIRETSITFRSYTRKATLEEIVLELLQKEPIYFEGNTYNTLTELCAKYQVQPCNVFERLKYGKTLEEAVYLPIRNNGKRYEVEYEGKVYQNAAFLCREYHISKSLVKGQQRYKPEYSFIKCFQMIKQLRDECKWPDTEVFAFIPRLKVQGTFYKSLADFAAVIGMTRGQIDAYKSRHHYKNMIEALQAMQRDRIPAYKTEYGLLSYSEARKRRYTYAQIEKLEYIPENGKFWVTKATSVKSKLFSTSDIQSIVKKAMVKRMEKAYGKSWFEEDGASFPVRVTFMKDEAVIGLDTTGISLHKRGYRQNTAKAPISETLAAALIMLTPWRKDRILVDPFCGSGPFPIEAAMIAANMAPGMNLSFLSEAWLHLIPKKNWYDAVEEAQEQINLNIETDIQGYDIDAAVVHSARENARRAGVEELIHFQQRPVSELHHPKKYGFIITNPPYGERLEEKAELPALYRQIGESFDRLDTWSKYMITSYEDAQHYIGKKADKNRKIYNGMIKTYFYQYLGPKPPRREKN